MNLTDIHCHLLPNVDDGPTSVAEAVALLEEMHEQGVRRIIATPHYRPGMFEASMGRIWKHYQGMQKIAASRGIRLYLGCEYYRNPEIADLVKQRKRPSMAGSGYILIEFSPDDMFHTISNHIYFLCTQGFKPVIAHVERYGSCKDIKKLEELVELGAYIQVNADAVLGKQGRELKHFCRKLLKENVVDFIASDAHDLKHRKPELEKCAMYVEKKFGEQYAHRIFVDNPAKIIRDRRTT